MINNKQILIVGLIFLLLNYACKFDKQESFEPRLPNANNNHTIKNDSCLFSIKVKDSSIIFTDYNKSMRIKSFDTIGDIICSEIKAKNINPQYDLSVYLLLDSLTPFIIYDKLTENLKNIGIYGAFLKTSKTGFYERFSANFNDVRSEIVSLYGEKFNNDRYILSECQIVTNQDKDYEKPPPPPPPPPIPFYFYKSLAKIANLDSLAFCVLEIRDHSYIYNSRKLSAPELHKKIFDKRIVFIKLIETNTYSDLIKLIDLMEGVNRVRLNNFSIKKFNSVYDKLDNDSKMDIKREFIVLYKILTLAEQKFIAKLKDKVLDNVINTMQDNIRN